MAKVTGWSWLSALLLGAAACGSDGEDAANMAPAPSGSMPGGTSGTGGAGMVSPAPGQMPPLPPPDPNGPYTGRWVGTLRPYGGYLSVIMQGIGDQIVQLALETSVRSPGGSECVHVFWAPAPALVGADGKAEIPVRNKFYQTTAHVTFTASMEASIVVDGIESNTIVCPGSLTVGSAKIKWAPASATLARAELISDFESGSAIKSEAGREGAFEILDNVTKAVTPLVPEEAPPGLGRGHLAAHLRGNKVTVNNTIYAATLLQLRPLGGKPYDATGYGGMAFFVKLGEQQEMKKGPTTVRAIYETDAAMIESRAATECWQEPGFDDWRPVVLRWRDNAFKPETLQKLAAIRLTTYFYDSYDGWFDDVMFYK